MILTRVARRHAHHNTRKPDEMELTRGGAVLGCPHHRGHWRPLDASRAAGLLPARAPVRGLSDADWRDTARARGPAQEARASWCTASRALPGPSQAARIHPHAEGPRSLSDHLGNRALGGRAHGGRAWTAPVARAQIVPKDVRSRDGMLRMREASVATGSPRASRPWCE